MNSIALRDHYFGVLLGGTAAEREISLESGGNVGRSLVRGSTACQQSG